MYVDAAYCYRPRSVVYQSVCHSSEPCNSSWTDRDAVLAEDSCGPKEPCIIWGSRSPWEGAILPLPTGIWQGWPTVKYRDICGELSKNGWTSLDAVWDEDSGGPRNHVLDGNPDSRMGMGNFKGKGAVRCNISDSLPCVVRWETD